MENQDQKNAVKVYTGQDERGRDLTAFSSIQSFEAAQRMAQALAASALVPKEYQGNVANCIVALEISQRIGASPLMVSQNLHVIHGRPSWSSTFIIAALNSCGRFSPLRFKVDGQGDQLGCVASAIDKSGEILEGPRVSIAMAKAEGWYDRNGSKWKTLPELMLRYRAAAFFGRLYAPDILMGMKTEDEAHDIIDVTPTVVDPPAPTEAAAKISWLESKARTHPQAHHLRRMKGVISEEAKQVAEKQNGACVEIRFRAGEQEEDIRRADTRNVSHSRRARCAVPGKNQQTHARQLAVER